MVPYSSWCTHLACFLSQPKTSCPGMPRHSELGLPMWFEWRKCLAIMPPVSFYEGSFSVEVSPSMMILVCVTLIKPNKHSGVLSLAKYFWKSWGSENLHSSLCRVMEDSKSFFSEALPPNCFQSPVGEWLIFIINTPREDSMAWKRSQTGFCML